MENSGVAKGLSFCEDSPFVYSYLLCLSPPAAGSPYTESHLSSGTYPYLHNTIGISPLKFLYSSASSYPSHTCRYITAPSGHPLLAYWLLSFSYYYFHLYRYPLLEIFHFNYEENLAEMIS